MPDVYVGGTRIRLSQATLKTEGGEAEIHYIGGGRVLKLYKPPNHPSYDNDPSAQEGARRRLATIGEKLKQFPKGLPARIVVPLELATDSSGTRVLGYTMRFLAGAEVLFRYGKRNFRSQGVSNKAIVDIFMDLHQTVRDTHANGVVFGDFNDLNVLVKGTEAHIVDIDSAQFGRFLTQMFTSEFVDPLLCDPHAKNLKLIRPHNESSDWYAYAAMLYRSLLYIGPYGGVFEPKNIAERVNRDERPLHRITVLHSEVRYPAAADPPGILSDELLGLFHEIFEKDKRGEFPLRYLLNLSWTVCPGCGLEHARLRCPVCALIVPVSKPEVKVVQGQVTVTSVFKTATGRILIAAYQGGKLRYLYHESGQYKREDGRVVTQGALSPQVRFRIRGDETLLGDASGRITAFRHDGSQEQLFADVYGTLPVFDANEENVFWTYADDLLRRGQWAPERIGAILSGKTLFWVGPEFGFGFYRAGTVSVAFVFDARGSAVKDTVKLPIIRGQLIDSTVVFTRDLCWFFVTFRDSGQTRNRCMLIKRDGTLVATAEADADDGTWLGTIRGKCAVGDFLLAPTDNGIVRVAQTGNDLVVTREFPGTEPYVNSDTQLFPGTGGLYAVTGKEVNLISIG